MLFEDRLRELIRADARRMRLLRALRALSLADGWIGAGCVRNAVWDALHGRPPSSPAGDVDVVWFDRARTCPGRDLALERRLRVLAPGIVWSVKNQSRMHEGNGDAPYRDVCEAMRFWPETATAVAVRLRADDVLEVAAPFGLTDLFAGVVRPTARFRREKRGLFDARVQSKRWLEHWPLLRVDDRLPA
ncbi:nucleotidyltransferase family protein [Paludibacterium yongneupense]|uniref:nucleotidyltransferase family protein n=1 Tax=Paludibacterium yongneupense TaxID=400061 RepID=UPI0003FEBD23|nr:nucleotidyltransferase family protein [Paludibacterium yongneupense]